MDTPQKIYRFPRKRSALILSVVCLVFALLPFVEIVVILISKKKFEVDLIGVTLFFLLFWGSFAFICYQWASTAKLVVSPSQIVCDDLASLVGFSTRWENIRNIEVSKKRLILWLEEASTPISKVGRWTQRHNVIRPDAIDLSSFIDHWKSGELKRDFEKYAPHLFMSGEQPESHAA